MFLVAIIAFPHNVQEYSKVVGECQLQMGWLGDRYLVHANGNYCTLYSAQRHLHTLNAYISSPDYTSAYLQLHAFSHLATPHLAPILTRLIRLIRYALGLLADQSQLENPQIQLPLRPQGKTMGTQTAQNTTEAAVQHVAPPPPPYPKSASVSTGVQTTQNATESAVQHVAPPPPPYPKSASVSTAVQTAQSTTEAAVQHVPPPPPRLRTNPSESKEEATTQLFSQVNRYSRQIEETFIMQQSLLEKCLEDLESTQHLQALLDSSLKDLRALHEENLKLLKDNAFLKKHQRNLNGRLRSLELEIRKVQTNSQ